MDRPKLPPRYDRVDADAVIREYRDKIPVEQIQKRHQLGGGSFYALLDLMNEPRRRPIGIRTRKSAAERLRKFAEQRILNLERQARAVKGGKLDDDGVATMMSLARVLEQVMRLQSSKAAGNDVAQHAELAPITDERRRELARRLAALCGASGPPEPAEGAA